MQIDSSGIPIGLTVFEPKEAVRSAFIMNCATGAKQNYYYKFAGYLQSKGHLVITYDYSGIGASAPDRMRGFECSVVRWGEQDLTAVINHVTANYKYEKLIVIGLSIGGLLPGMTAANDKIDGLVNVASQSGYWRMWGFPMNVLLLLNWYLLAITTRLFGYFPGKRLGIMENLPKGVAMDWANWGRSPEYAFDYVEKAHRRFASLSVPLLSYSFPDDQKAPKQTVEWLNSKYSNCQVIHKHIEPSSINLKSIGHFGFFRSKCQDLWDDALQEVEQF